MRILVAGGGIAGVECALTLALGLPSADVTLVHRWPSLRLLPNLVYVPFGVSAHRLDIPIAAELEPLGIRCVDGLVERIDADARTAIVDGVPVGYDALVLATGTEPVAPRAGSRTLRSLDDALLLRADLEQLHHDGKGAITVMQLPQNTWPAPGYEFANLLGTWKHARDLRDIEVALVTSAMTPLSLFGLHAAEAVSNRLKELGVDVVSGVPAGRIEDLARGLTVDMGDLRAQRVPGAPAPNAEGFFTTAPDGSIGPDIYAVGDAADLPFKAGFATSWQSRRVLMTLGGELANLGDEIGGIPVDECEYQMDLGNETLAVRIPCRDTFSGSWTELLAQREVTVRDQAPGKLLGTMVGEKLLSNHRETNAAMSFHRLMVS